MTQHQGLPVAGYQPQNQSAVDKVNSNKVIEEMALRILDELQNDGQVDQRCLAIGRTNLQQAFMWINRAIFKPGRVVLPEDNGAAS